MASKLDQSLDEILTTRRQSARRGRGGRRVGGPKRAVAAPVGGVQKPAAKPAKNTMKTAPTSGHQGSKIIVSNLPSDVGETQIKEYFSKTIGPIRRVLVTYNQNGISRGIASIHFSQPDAANKALKQLNGVSVDKRPMKIEVVLDAKTAPPPEIVKPLAERVSQPKAQPKPAVTTKSTNSVRGGKRGHVRRGRNAGRPKPKTAEELDQEMADYFESSAANNVAPATNGAMSGTEAVSTGDGDLGMDIQ